MKGGGGDPSKYEAQISYERTKMGQEVSDESNKLQKEALEAKQAALDYLDEGYGLLSNFLSVQTGQMRDTNTFLNRIRSEDVPALQQQAAAGATLLNDNLLSNFNKYKSSLGG